MTRTTSRAFTLIELLVVISIVTLLISMLLPALSKARDAAKQAKCLAGARQTAVAVFNYAADNKQYVVSGRTHYANALPGSPSYAYFGILVDNGYSGPDLYRNKGGCPWSQKSYWGNNYWYSYGDGHDYYSNPDGDSGTSYGLNGTLQSGYGMTNPYVSPYWARHGTMRFDDARLRDHAPYTPLILDSHIPWRCDTASPTVALYQMLGVNSYGIQSQNPRHNGLGLNSVSADGAGHWIVKEVVLNSAVWSKDNYFLGFYYLNYNGGMIDSGQTMRSW